MYAHWLCNSRRSHCSLYIHWVAALNPVCSYYDKQAVKLRTATKWTVGLPGLPRNSRGKWVLLEGGLIWCTHGATTQYISVKRYWSLWIYAYINIEKCPHYKRHPILELPRRLSSDLYFSVISSVMQIYVLDSSTHWTLLVILSKQQQNHVDRINSPLIGCNSNNYDELSKS